MYFNGDDGEEEEESIPSLLEFMPADILLDIFKFLDWRDLCQLSCTSVKFRSIVQSATLWSGLKNLDFEHCMIPDPAKILTVLNRCPNVERVMLGDVLTDASPPLPPGMEEEDHDDDEDMDDSRPQNVRGADKFVLDVLRVCQHLRSLSVHMTEVTDRAVEAVSAKCSSLQKFHLIENDYVRKRAIIDLLSNTNTLTELLIESCDNVSFPSIRHSDPIQSLTLTHISLLDIQLVTENVTMLLRNCKSLLYLDMSGAEHLHNLTIDVPQGQRSGLDTLQQLVMRKCQMLAVIKIPYCPSLHTLDISLSTAVTEVTMNSPLLRTLTMDGCVDVSTMKLTTSDITRLSCGHMRHLLQLQIGSKCLTSLDLSGCITLSADQILECVMDKESLSDLNIHGCRQVEPGDVNTLLLPQFSGLRKLTFGGHSWTQIELKSGTLRELEVNSCPNVACIPLNMASLENLVLRNCRDISEQELIDGLLYGREIKKKQGLESLIDDTIKEEPFGNDTGTPSLRTFTCVKVPGVYGEYISNNMHHFRHLTTMEFIQCSVASCVIDGWSSLTHLKIESCSRLKKVFVRNVASLVAVDVRWCGMVEDFKMTEVGVTSLDTTGTNFSHLHMCCDHLQKLLLTGVCTQPQHTVKIRCRALQELSVMKCDRLSETVISNIFLQSPRLRSLTLVASLSLRHLTVPSHIEVCSLTGHRVLREITLQSPVCIRHLTLNNLPKLLPEHRLAILKQCESSLRTLELRAIPGEKTLHLHLHNVTSLTLDQGIHLATLEINCTKLQYMRIQGCPNLHELCLHLDNLSQMQVYHSAPLLALRTLHLHCTRLSYLATVLRHYCPRIQALSLYRSELRSSQIYRLGHNLCDLHTLTLHDCNVRDMEKSMTSLLIEAASINRSNGTNMTVQFRSGI